MMRTMSVLMLASIRFFVVGVFDGPTIRAQQQRIRSGADGNEARSAAFHFRRRQATRWTTALPAASPRWSKQRFGCGPEIEIAPKVDQQQPIAVVAPWYRRRNAFGPRTAPSGRW